MMGALRRLALRVAGGGCVGRGGSGVMHRDCRRRGRSVQDEHGAEREPRQKGGELHERGHSNRNNAGRRPAAGAVLRRSGHARGLT